MSHFRNFDIWISWVLFMAWIAIFYLVWNTASIWIVLLIPIKHVKVTSLTCFKFWAFEKGLWLSLLGKGILTREMNPRQIAPRQSHTMLPKAKDSNLSVSLICNHCHLTKSIKQNLRPWTNWRPEALFSIRHKKVISTLIKQCQYINAPPIVSFKHFLHVK